MDTYGWILFQQSKYIEAEKWIAKALAISSESGEVLEHMGDVQFKLNKPDEALKYWKKAKDAGKESPILERKIAEKTWYE
jgi:Tfp pilus assembly protein PilF